MTSSTIDYYNSHSDELITRYDNADMSKVHRILDRYIEEKWSWTKLKSDERKKLGKVVEFKELGSLN